MIVYVNGKDSLYKLLKDFNHKELNALEELKKEYKAYKESGRHKDSFNRLFEHKYAVNRNFSIINECMDWSSTENYDFWCTVDYKLIIEPKSIINDITEMDLMCTNTTIAEEEYL